MRVSFRNRRINVSAQAYEEVLFDIGTDKYFTQFNGKGGFNYFHYVNNPRYNFNNPSILKIYLDDVLMSPFTRKKVINGGRSQKIIFKFDNGQIEIKQFGFGSYIFYRYSYKFNKPLELVFAIDCTAFKDVPALYTKHDFEYCEPNYAYYIVCNKMEDSFDVVMSFTDDPKQIIDKTQDIEKIIDDEIDLAFLPEAASNDFMKNLYLTSLFAALENYKTIDTFDAFSAGENYLVPLRTYYRDSYWTILPLFKLRIDLVKKQILALSKGMKDDGECPSAVKSDNTAFWGGHYDSPLFFVMMVFDFINNGGNADILEVRPNGTKNIKELCIAAIERSMRLCDDTHLIYKKGPYNKLDWADAGNRNGYVTYDECLFYRALRCLDSLLGGNTKYLKEALLVKESINKILWSEEKSYYVNYKDETFCEDHLFVDTCLAVLFDVAPEDRKKKVLDKFEELLYSKKHPELKDFGLLSAYPLHRGYRHLVTYSSEPYRYHNGACWPYWSGLVAHMMRINGRDWTYPLTRWFKYEIENRKFTAYEFLTPYGKEGSKLQAWSATSAFALLLDKNKFFI